MRAKAANIVADLVSSISPLDDEKMHQLSMDGPKTNWKVLSLLNTGRQEKGNNELIDVGSCGLHVVSGAFQNGVEAAHWGVMESSQVHVEVAG